MTNNDILKKLRVALQLRDEEILAILELAEFKVTQAELSALFRKEGHPNYKECGDQLLRNFLNGLILHLRGPQKNGVEQSPSTIRVKEQGQMQAGGSRLVRKKPIQAAGTPSHSVKKARPKPKD
ncbi:MAG: DUF1456 family protein [Marinilabiliales bacterium]|nr:DUF1456 family protein [Marinilabiliales bacterium]